MTINIDQPEVVSSDSVLRIHAREGKIFPFTFLDEAGDPRDVSTADIWFEVEGKFQTKLQPGVEDNELTLTVSQAQSVTLLNKLYDFALIDKTYTVPTVLWEGSITSYGW